jgi:hypothetical protein
MSWGFSAGAAPGKPGEIRSECVGKIERAAAERVGRQWCPGLQVGAEVNDRIGTRRADQREIELAVAETEAAVAVDKIKRINDGFG